MGYEEVKTELFYPFSFVALLKCHVGFLNNISAMFLEKLGQSVL